MLLVMIGRVRLPLLSGVAALGSRTSKQGYLKCTRIGHLEPLAL